MQKLFISILLLCLLAFSPLVKAEENNIHGIHLAVPTESDIVAAAALVNSNGGDWGYVTLVIQDNDLDYNKWQGAFNKMRELHLIPIVRLATHPEGESWAVPKSEDITRWVEFLNSLNWVVKKRYVILFNEPNHGAEWGGAVDPEGYARIAKELAVALKKSNQDYFLMLAGLDQSPPNAPPRYLDVQSFISRMTKEFGPANIDRYIDGWSSHSYPNPGFAGSPQGSGWGTIRGYENELAYLKEKGVKRELPVFITETGWRRSALGEQYTAQNYRQAYQIWAEDQRVKAVTPFILNYQTEPFLDFSFQKPGESTFFAQYDALKDLGKTAGEPEQIEKMIIYNSLPSELVQDSSFRFELDIENRGQGAWDSRADYELKLISKSSYYYSFTPLANITPGVRTKLDFDFHTPETLGESVIKIGLFKKGKLVAESAPWRIQILPLATLEVQYRLLGFNNNGDNFQVELYDPREHLVYLTKNLVGQRGQIHLEKVRNVALGERYRVVLLKPGYLPRQAFVVFRKDANVVKMPVSWPLDFSGDGALSTADFWALFGRKQ